MAMPAGTTLAFCLLLDLATQGTQADTCYSKHSGFINCRNGCCGPEDGQDCCSHTFLIMGLVLGTVLAGVVVVVAVLCWVFKDCGPKMCRWCHGASRRGERGRRGRHGRHGGRRGRTRRVLVHPVEPPDYITATQERAPSVQPGLNHRIIPLSPPPPYMEMETEQHPAGPVPPHHSTYRAANIATAPVDSVLMPGNVAHSASTVTASVDVAGQSSNSNTYAYGADFAMNTNNLQPHEVNSVFVVPSSGPGSIHNSSTFGNSSNDAGSTSTYPANHCSETTSSAKSTTAAVVPGANPPANCVVQSTALTHMREMPGSGSSGDSSDNVHGGSSHGIVSGHSQPEPAYHSDGKVLATVRESAEDGDHLFLI